MHVSLVISQILSMTLVAEQEEKANTGKDNESIIHLRNESSRMETRLIELCGEKFGDIKTDLKKHGMNYSTITTTT